MTFNYHIPTKVIFGAGILQQLATHPLPGKKALIVTTQGTVKRGLADTVQALLKKTRYCLRSLRQGTFQSHARPCG